MVAQKPSFRVESRGQNVIAVRFPDVSDGWEKRCLLRACAHWDHPNTDLKLQAEHLQQAIDSDSPILDFGDLFCAMQAKKDPRSTKEGVRGEHQKNAWVNAIMDDAVEWHAPYARWWALNGYGNHETGFLKHNEYDLIREFTRRMRSENSGQGYSGGYWGFVQFMFTARKTQRFQKVLWYTHGRGGAAPVGRGLGKAIRRAAWYPDADVVVSAHLHDEYKVWVDRIRLTTHGQIWKDRQLHLQIPSYKDALLLDPVGFESNHELSPKGIGAIWLMLKFTKGTMHLDAVSAV